MVKVTESQTIVTKVSITPASLDGGGWEGNLPTLFIQDEENDTVFLSIETPGDGVSVSRYQLFEALELLGRKS